MQFTGFGCWRDAQQRRWHRLQLVFAASYTNNGEKEKYYATGEQGVYQVTNFMEMEDVDFMKGGIIS